MFDPAVANLGSNSSPYENHTVAPNNQSSISNRFVEQHPNGTLTSSSSYLQNTPRYTPVTTQINSFTGNRFGNDINMPGLIDISGASTNIIGSQNGGSPTVNGGLMTNVGSLPPIDESLCGFGSVISRAPPDSEDKTIQQNLEQYIQSQGIFENDDDLFRRIQALTLLEKVCSRWIKSVYARLNAYTKQQIDEVNGSLFTFGSYRLGVHFRGGDIDALLLAPRRVEREQFFTEMPQLLREQPECESVTPVPDAFAPIITMVLGGVEMDLLFCQCRLLDSIPQSLNVLQIDVQNFTATLKDLRSLNGCRVNEYILSCVPQPETFRNALRAIKYWAKRRCIYSNILGYLGGVSWALLVAFTCQHYPYANAAMIVKKMFLVFSEWDWPQPVFVRDPRDMDNESSIENNLSGMPVWDARINTSDRAQLMPIITPVFPQQNTTYNVQRSQFVILLSEINRGYSICEKIWRNEAKWEKLFEPLPFFLHRHYVVVIAESSDEEIFKSYCGFVESRLRKLVELVGNKQDIIRLCRAHPRQFGVARATRPSAMWLFGLDLKKDELKKDIRLPPNAFTEVGQRFINDIMLDPQQRAPWDDDMVRTQVKQATRRELLNLLPEEVINEYSDLRQFADAVKQRAEKAAQARTAMSTSAVTPLRVTSSTGSLASPEQPNTSTQQSSAVYAAASPLVPSSVVMSDSDVSFNNNSLMNANEPASPTVSTAHVKHSVSSGDIPSQTAKRPSADSREGPNDRKRLKSSSSTSSLTVPIKTQSSSPPSSPPTATTSTRRSPAKVVTDIKLMEESNMDRRHMADIDARDLRAQAAAASRNAVNGTPPTPTNNKRSATDDDDDDEPLMKRVKSDPISNDNVRTLLSASVTETPSSQLLDSDLPPDFLKLLPIRRKEQPVLSDTVVVFSSATPDLSFSEDDSGNNNSNVTNNSSSGDDADGFSQQRQNLATPNFGTAKPIT